MQAATMMRSFFEPLDTFKESERILQHKITALLVVTFSLGIGIAAFAVYRLGEGNIIAGTSQVIFSIFLMAGFWLLKHNKKSFVPFSIFFFLLFFIYINIVFFYVPQNRLNILWIATAPVPIFFFLDRRAGFLILTLLLGFVLYLILSRYPYTVAEYITLLATLGTTALILYTYEKIKDGEQERLKNYSHRLENAIAEQTKTLHEQNLALEASRDSLEQLNLQLEARIETEVRKRLEQEQMLLRQCRMASMGEMLDCIAHQWRQPLMNINVQLMHLEHAVNGVAETKKPIAAISELTAHMSETIENFRALFAPERSQERFDLATLVNEVERLMHPSLHHVRRRTDIASGLTLETNRSELLQVLIILIANAAELFEVRKIPNPVLRIGAADNGSEIVIRIEDNAGGIETDPIERIFDPYFSTKKHSGGSGLGLYIAKIIVERNMCGRIEAANMENGALFSLILPQKGATCSLC